ncbi:ABC transporter permease [Parabacteroides goldsteinii]|uniref:ABC transporter permease n=1 Tax=Parabacteroides goldsteinii TaxID=328812 RepID=UPI003AB1FBBD
MPACNFSLLAILCTLISVFGLYSVSSSNITQRRKEVAIRKVTGASSRTIIGMFIREYVSIVIVANLIALPLAWLFMRGWLEQYPYRINISAWMYLTILLFTSILIICTVLYQTLKAAKANPAVSIKSE